MIYSENIFVAIAAPLFIALFLIKGETRRFIGFFIYGLLACLLGAYINGFLAAASAMTATEAAVKLTPISEEILKAVPVLFYMAAAKPKRDSLITAALAVGLGFATFENICLLAQAGAGDFLFALIRGLVAGVTHAACAALLGYGLAFISEKKYRHLLFPGTLGLLCACAVFHAIYNLLVTAERGWQGAGYALPLLMTLAVLLWRKRIDLKQE